MDADLQHHVCQLADEWGVERNALLAVTMVESNGSGFWHPGPGVKQPIILFEPHVFWRCLPEDKRDLAARRGLAYRRWGEKPYPRTQAERWRQYWDACRIDPEAAAKACSWGAFQVLGENAEWLGYPSAVEMAETAHTIEGQVAMFERFCEKRRLVRAIRDRDWRAFARKYNGSGQVDYYAGRIAAAYNRL